MLSRCVCYCVYLVSQNISAEVIPWYQNLISAYVSMAPVCHSLAVFTVTCQRILQNNSKMYNWLTSSIYELPYVRDSMLDIHESTR